MADGHGHAPGLQAAHGAERDEDLELALKLHRELNAVPRRQRAPPRTQAAAAALKTLTKKHQPEQEDSGISSSSESETEGRYKGGPPSGAFVCRSSELGTHRCTRAVGPCMTAAACVFDGWAFGRQVAAGLDQSNDLQAACPSRHLK